MHPELERFPIVVELDVAWGDMDSFGHVNNVVYFRYFEHSRVAYLDRIGWFRSAKERGLGPIVSATNARFRKPLSYPDRVFIGSRIVARATDRVTFEHRLVSQKWDGIACEGQAVVVSFDYQNVAKVLIPDDIVAAITELETETKEPLNTIVERHQEQQYSE